MTYNAGQVLFVVPDDDQAIIDARDYIKRMGFTWHQVKIKRRTDQYGTYVCVVAQLPVGE